MWYEVEPYKHDFLYNYTYCVSERVRTLLFTQHQLFSFLRLATIKWILHDGFSFA